MPFDSNNATPGTLELTPTRH